MTASVATVVDKGTRSWTWVRLAHRGISGQGEHREALQPDVKVQKLVSGKQTEERRQLQHVQYISGMSVRSSTLAYDCISRNMLASRCCSCSLEMKSAKLVASASTLTAN
jgi:hypothetical protein